MVLVQVLVRQQMSRLLEEEVLVLVLVLESVESEEEELRA